ALTNGSSTTQQASLSGTGSAASLSIAGGTTYLVNGKALVVSGQISGGGALDATGSAVSVGNGITVTTYTKDTSSALTFTGSGPWSGTANQDYGFVTVGGGTVTVGNNLKAS